MFRHPSGVLDDGVHEAVISLPLLELHVSLFLLQLLNIPLLKVIKSLSFRRLSLGIRYKLTDAALDLLSEMIQRLLHDWLLALGVGQQGLKPALLELLVLEALDVQVLELFADCSLVLLLKAAE